MNVKCVVQMYVMMSSTVLRFFYPNWLENNQSMVTFGQKTHYIVRFTFFVIFALSTEKLLNLTWFLTKK